MRAGCRVDEVSIRLSESAKGLFGSLRQRLSRAYELLMRIAPGRLLGQKKVELANLANAAEAAMKEVFAKNNLQLTAIENRFRAMNPRAVLGRGYSITISKKSGRVINGMR